MLFSRAVIRDEADKDKAIVKVKVTGSFDGITGNCGSLTFPSTQSWAKFWGAVHHGALKIPDLEVRMENANVDGPDITEEELLDKSLGEPGGQPDQQQGLAKEGVATKGEGDTK